VESTNKFLEAILTKTIQLHHQNWADRLPEALWVNQTTWRNTTRNKPYDLVHGKQVLLPIEFQIKTFRIGFKLRMDLSEDQQQRITQLNELENIRQDAIHHTTIIQKQRMKLHEKFIRKKKFKPGD